MVLIIKISSVPNNKSSTAANISLVTGPYTLSNTAIINNGFPFLAQLLLCVIIELMDCAFLQFAM